MMGATLSVRAWLQFFEHLSNRVFFLLLCKIIQKMKHNTKYYWIDVIYGERYVFTKIAKVSLINYILKYLVNCLVLEILLELFLELLSLVPIEIFDMDTTKCVNTSSKPPCFFDSHKGSNRKCVQSFDKKMT